MNSSRVDPPVIAYFQRPTVRTTVLACILFGFALLLRLGFIHDSQPLADFRTPTPGLDTCLHWEAAKHIRAGTPDPVFELMLPSAPLHPYFVALCQTFLGENIERHRIFRAFMGSTTVLLVFLSALLISGRRWAAATAALLAATLHTWIYFDTMIIKAVVDLFLLTLSLWLVIQLKDESSLRRHLLVAFAVGALFSLLRFSQGGSILYALAVVIYWLSRRAPRLTHRIATCSILLLMVTASQLGFKYRDVLFGLPKTHFLPVGGVHVRIGWQDHAIGSYHILRRFPAMPLGHTFFSRMCAEALNGRSMTPGEADRSYIQEAKDFIRENPDQILPIIGRKISLFFNNFEPSDNHFLPHIAARVPLLRLPSPGFGGLTLLAFWGIVGLVRSGRRDLAWLLGGMILITLFSNIVAFVSSRYRLHATVPLAMLSSAGLVYLAQTIRSSRKQQIITVLITLVLGLWVYRIDSPATRGMKLIGPVLPNARTAMMDTGERNLLQSQRSETNRLEIAKLDAMGSLTSTQQFIRATLLHSIGRYTDSFHGLRDVARETTSVTGANRQYVIDLMWYADYDAVVDYFVELKKRDPVAFRTLDTSFASNSGYWKGADPNLRLIVQAILRDIINPRLIARMKEESSRL